MMWGRQVGAVALDPQTNHYAFSYDPKWIRAGGPSLSPRYMPLSETAVYVFPSLNEETYKRLPSAIADSLPDRFGNALIDEYMAGKGVASPPLREPTTPSKMVWPICHTPCMATPQVVLCTLK